MVRWHSGSVVLFRLFSSSSVLWIITYLIPWFSSLLHFDFPILWFSGFPISLVLWFFGSLFLLFLGSLVLFFSSKNYGLILQLSGSLGFSILLFSTSKVLLYYGSIFPWESGFMVLCVSASLVLWFSGSLVLLF